MRMSYNVCTAETPAASIVSHKVVDVTVATGGAWVMGRDAM